MRLLIFMVFSCCVIFGVDAKGSGVRALTESMGQEVIEIGGPLKEMPQDLEEEPSAEVDDDDDDDKETTAPRPVATKKETPKVVATLPANTRRQMKDVEKIDHAQEDEESRIEKEISEIYKDTDYKSDSSEVKGQKNKTTTKQATVTQVYTSESIEVLDPIVNNSIEESKPIARARANFKFQPDRSEDVERWRTSVDDIACARGATKKMAAEEAEFPQKLNGTTKQVKDCKKGRLPGSAVRSSINVALLLVMSFLF